MIVYNHNDIKEWYQATYPDDEMGKELVPNTDWSMLWIALINQQEIYDILGVEDSVVRERVFSELADTLGVDYDVVYNAWLGDNRRALLALMKK